MTTARCETLVEEEAIYHCISRCVRRAYLYGYDAVTGNNYDHRKRWLRNRLIFLTQIFSIEVLQCALMDNHEHTMLRTRPDLHAKLSDEEIVRRWLTLFPKRGISNDFNSSAAQCYVKNLLEDKERVEVLRERLVNISWFMKSLNEYIARKANKEDKCKGRFWEGRFKCQRLEGEGAVLACAVYIDLNPIRAKKAETPETSEYTSAFERIRALKNMKDKTKEPELWLAPIRDSPSVKAFFR